MLRPAASAKTLKSLRILPNHIQCIGADGTGGTQNCQGTVGMISSYDSIISCGANTTIMLIDEPEAFVFRSNSV